MDSPKGSLDISSQQRLSYDDAARDLELDTPTTPSWNREFQLPTDAPESAVALPPVDSGFHAYAYLASAFTFELLVWSFPFSYGVFLNYYTTTLFSPDDPQLALLPIVGTLSSGIIYMSSLLVLPLLLRHPAHKQTVSLVGLVMCIAGLVGAGFSTRPAHLIVTQGIVYSLGGTLLYFPVLTYLIEWFSVKRGLANGILFSGTGLGGVIVPFVAEYLLHRFGHRLAFIILAAIFGALAIPAFIYAKPRLPVAAQINNSSSAMMDISFIRNRAFWVFFTANVVQAFVNFLPGIYIPSFASDLKLSTTSGTLALALMNAASVPGLILIGGMSDKLDLRVAISMSTVGSAFAVLFVWGFTGRLAPLLVFSVLYGFFSGGFSVLWPKFIGVISKDDPRLYSTLMSLFVSSRGLGNVLSGPISTALLKHSPLHDQATFGYGLKGYGPLIIFSGFGMLVSTFAVAYPYFVPAPKEENLHLRSVRQAPARRMTDD